MECSNWVNKHVSHVSLIYVKKKTIGIVLKIFDVFKYAKFAKTKLFYSFLLLINTAKNIIHLFYTFI